MSPPHIGFYVQQLLGTGHVQRTSALVRAMQAAGIRVTVLFGGGQADMARYGDVPLVHLPEIRATDTAFAGLMDAEGNPVSDAIWAQRRSKLEAFLAQDCPDAVMTELFPFGRRAFAPEILGFLAAFRACRPDGQIWCSLRDIIVPPQKESRLLQSMDWARTWYDRIFVHTDPAVVPLAASLSLPPDLAARAIETGYVVSQDDGLELRDHWPVPPIVVASGGGAVGGALMDAALDARLHGCMADVPWLFLVGRHLPAPVAARLAAAVNPTAQMYVQPNRPDYRALLAHCRLSVSQAGYNTLMDLLALGHRGVVVPFVGAGETEQALRAKIFAERGWVWTVPEADLTPQNLAQAIERACAAPAKLYAPPEVRLDGAGWTARWMTDWFAGRT